MAFNYEAGTATDVADWFTKLEAFMILLGWTIEDGSGTQTIVFKSIGEGGARTKLHCRLRQDGGNPNRVYYRVQDDIAGTHTTTEGTFAEQLDAGNGGAAPFDWWMCGDRDCLNVVFLTAGTYTGCYVGIVERFAVTVPDEEYEMVSVTPDRFDTSGCGYVLRIHDGTWDQLATPFNFTNTYEKNPLDNSYMIAGVCIKEHTVNNDSILGQLKHISGRMNTVAGLNAQDTIATAFGGATSWWTVFGTGTMRWALHTGGTLPVGAWEGGFSYTSGAAADIDDLNAKFKAFLATHGWSEVANPSPSWPIDYYLNSSGQMGGDDIWLRWRYDRAQRYWGGWVQDDVSCSHNTGYHSVGDPRVDPGDFPLNYFIAGDGDCFIHGVEIASAWYWGWFGMFTMFMGDPASIDTVYKVGYATLTGGSMLRYMNGTWAQPLTFFGDMFNNSSPNLLDGTSYIIWPNPLQEPPGPWPAGHPKYLHRLSSTAIAVNDTVTIGARRYRYLGNRFAHRDI